MEEESKEKIEKTVREILKESDMREMTEFKVRNLASERLGIDLSEKSHKAYVRGIVKSFLEEEELKENQEKDKDEVEEEEEEGAKDVGKGNKEFDDDGDLIICRLSDKRRVTIQEFRGKTLVSIREYYKKDGKELPSSKEEDDEQLAGGLEEDNDEPHNNNLPDDDPIDTHTDGSYSEDHFLANCFCEVPLHDHHPQLLLTPLQEEIY